VEHVLLMSTPAAPAAAAAAAAAMVAASVSSTAVCKTREHSIKRGGAAPQETVSLAPPIPRQDAHSTRPDNSFTNKLRLNQTCKFYTAAPNSEADRHITKNVIHTSSMTQK
jgi:hypothetical protein